MDGNADFVEDGDAECDFQLSDGSEEVNSAEDASNAQTASGSPSSMTKASEMKVKMLTDKDDLSAYSIEQVVLPLPGTTVMRSGIPEVAACYADAEAIFEGSSLNKAVSSPGTYRKLIAKAKDLEWKLLKYRSANDDLPDQAISDEQGDGENCMTALQISFSLSTSSYATMCLRELFLLED